MKTYQVLSALSARYSCKTDAEIARLLGVRRAAIYNYRRNPQSMADQVAIRAAELLDLDPGQLLAWMHAERTQSPQLKKIWKSVADRLSDCKAA